MKFNLFKMNNIFLPSNLSIWWNIGSLISIMMLMQILSGLMISINFMNMNNLFFNNFNMFYNSNFNWMLKIFHNNNTSFIFIFIYLHIIRNIKFNSFFNLNMWLSGYILLMINMTIAFLGYSLPQNQMSFWGLTVIINLLTLIPNLKLNFFIWGNFFINEFTFNRMFIIHFLTPMIMILLMIIHLLILHKINSNNPLSLKILMDTIKLNYYLMKDLCFLMIMFIFMYISMLNYPYFFNNKDYFIFMNPLQTPNQIEPEWYFMFFYSILRSISNKINGVLIMITFIIMILFLPIIKDYIQSNYFNIINMIINYMILLLFMNLLIMGFKMIEYPYPNYNHFLIITVLILMFMKKTMKFINKLTVTS